MSNKQSRELHELDTAELHRRLEEAQQNLIGTRFSLATHQTQNTAGLKTTRRQIARIKTILYEREREA